MKKLLQIRIAGNVYDPQLNVNTQRTGAFDVLTGPTGEHFNSLFKASRFNVTWITSSEEGNCFANRTCTGIVQLLREGSADSSIIPNIMTFAPEYNVEQNDPIYAGPIKSQYSVLYSSLPYKQAYTLNADILSTFEETSWKIYASQLFIILSLYLLINYSVDFKLVRILPTKKRKYNINAIEIIGMYLKQIKKNYRTPHRFISIFMLLVHSALLIVIISGSIRSNMVSEFPAKYFSSVDEIIEHNMTIALVKGLFFHKKVMSSDEEWLKKIGKLAEIYEVLSLTSSPSSIARGTVCMMTNNIMLLVHVILCSQLPEKYTLFRDSQPFINEFGYTAISPHSSNELKYRISRSSQLLMESGVHDYYLYGKVAQESAYLLTGEYMTYFRCETKKLLTRKSNSATSLQSFTFKHFRRLIIYSFILMIISFDILSIERLIKSRTRLFRNNEFKRLNRIRCKH